MDQAARIEALEAENDALRASLAELRQALGLALAAPLEWGLTAAETRMVGVLAKREFASRQALLAAIHADLTRDAPDQKIVDVLVCRVRRKLAPFGVAITTVWGQGYALDRGAKAAIAAALDRGRAAA